MTVDQLQTKLTQEDRDRITRIIQDKKANVSEDSIRLFLKMLDETCDDYRMHCENPLINTTSDQRSKMLYRFADSMKKTAEQFEFLLERTDLQLSFVTTYYRPQSPRPEFPTKDNGDEDTFVRSLNSLEARLSFLGDQISFLNRYARQLADAHKNKNPLPRKNFPLHFMASDLASGVFFILGVEPKSPETGLFACIFREMRRIVTQNEDASDDVSTFVRPAIKEFREVPE